MVGRNKMAMFNSFSVKFFSSFGCLYAKNSIRQRFTALTKLLERGNKRAGLTANPPDVFSQPVVAKGGKMFPMEETRRQVVLNNLLLERLSDLMSTGEISKEFGGYGLEILRVQTSKGFNSVKVLWVCKCGHEDHIQALLNINARKIRSILINQHLLGNVPQINFIYDKSEATRNHIFQVLDKAKSDATIQDMTDNLRQIPVVTKVRNCDADMQFEDRDLPRNVSCEEMTNDIYGIDQAAMMRTVVERCSKQSKVSNEKETAVVAHSQQMFANESEEKFKKFLQERKRKKRKKERFTNDNFSTTHFDSCHLEDNTDDFYDEQVIDDIDYDNNDFKQK